MTMKLSIASFLFLLFSAITFAQNMDNKNIEQRLAAIEDKMAIKYVVDEFSNLAIRKKLTSRSYSLPRMA
jgi:hypothetical protein